jgi:hypothetical protein
MLSAMHDELLHLYKTYTCTGGMPEIVAGYREAIN